MATKEEWINSHKCCPQCGSSDIEVSNMAVTASDDEYRDDINTAKCKCGWKGMVKNLVSDPSQSRTVKVELRTMDKDGDVYISCTDLVNALKTYQAGVLELLQAKSSRAQVEFTSSLFSEIYKTIITADYQHRVAKAAEQERIAKEAENDK